MGFLARSVMTDETSDKNDFDNIDIIKIVVSFNIQ